MYANRRGLSTWLVAAQFSNLSHFRIRRRLFSRFVPLLGRVEGADAVEVEFEELLSIRQFLAARNEQVSDAMRLSFENTLRELVERAEQ